MELTCGVNLQRWMTLWIKSLRVDEKPKYSTEKVNAIPTVVGCTVSHLSHICCPLVNKTSSRALSGCF